MSTTTRSAQPGPLVLAFREGMRETDSEVQALPQRLRGRGDFLVKRRRVKDPELMFDAALEIESLRSQLAHLRAALAKVSA